MRCDQFSSFPPAEFPRVCPPSLGQASLKVLWRAALPRLHAEAADVSSCVMLLDALLRGADEELLMTPELRSAMDELLGKGWG